MAYLYAEDTMVRVVAVDLEGNIASKVDGVVRLDEEPNPDFPSNTPPEFITRNWQLSYQKDPQDVVGPDLATDLRPNRQSPGDFTAVALVAGKTDPIRLRSLAGPRSEAGLTFSRNWTAKLFSCDAKPSIACSSASTPTAKFKPGTKDAQQWVDQQAYSRHTAFYPFARLDGGNGVRDWMEALAWDALSDATPRGDIIAAAAQCVPSMFEGAGTGPPDGGEAYAVTGGEAPHSVTWYPQSFNFDQFRWDREVCGFDAGMRWEAAAVLTSVALHEARHCWQKSWSQSLDVDGDSLPASPESIDPYALRLKDGRHYWVGGPLDNLENHFAGDAVGFGDFDLFHPDLKSIAGQALERDAHAFEQRATVGISFRTIVTGALSSATAVPEAMSLSAGTTRPSAISVTVRGQTGTCDASGPSSIPGVVVELEVVPLGQTAGSVTLAALSTAFGYANGNRYVAVTDSGGVARLDVSASANAAGTFNVRIWTRQIVTDGNVPGAVLNPIASGESAIVQVTVTP
jgi:hypothetical protein